MSSHPLDINLHMGRDKSVHYYISKTYKKCLAHNKPSINIYQISEQMHW